MELGMKRDECLSIVCLTKNQLYYEQKGTKPGKSPSQSANWRDPQSLITYEIDNVEVV